MTNNLNNLPLDFDYNVDALHPLLLNNLPLDFDYSFDALYPLLPSSPPLAPTQPPIPPVPEAYRRDLESLWDPFTSPSVPVAHPHPPLEPTPSASTSLGSPLSSPGTTISVSVSPPQKKRVYGLLCDPSDGAGPAPKRRPPTAPPPAPASLSQLNQWQLPRPPSPPITPAAASTSRIRPSDACKCRDKTQKPARHWRTACPYNTANHALFTCSRDACTKTFTRKDNMERHQRDYH